MTPIRTGNLVSIDGEPNLVITRSFGSPAEAVWQTLIDTHWLRQWIGYWEGDPTTGHVSFFMTAESDDPEPQRYTIVECDRPRRFAGDRRRAGGGLAALVRTRRGRGRHDVEVRAHPRTGRRSRLDRPRVGVLPRPRPGGS